MRIFCPGRFARPWLVASTTRRRREEEAGKTWNQIPEGPKGPETSMWGKDVDSHEVQLHIQMCWKSLPFWSVINLPGKGCLPRSVQSVDDRMTEEKLVKDFITELTMYIRGRVCTMQITVGSYLMPGAILDQNPVWSKTNWVVPFPAPIFFLKQTSGLMLQAMLRDVTLKNSSYNLQPQLQTFSNILLWIQPNFC